MRRDLHQAKSQGKCRPRSFSHLCRRDWRSRQPDLVQTRCADCRKKLKRETLRAQKAGGSFFSWQCECCEEGDGEREYENYQIHKSAKNEFKTTEEPALVINVPD